MTASSAPLGDSLPVKPEKLPSDGWLYNDLAKLALVPLASGRLAQLAPNRKRKSYHVADDAAVRTETHAVSL